MSPHRHGSRLPRALACCVVATFAMSAAKAASVAYTLNQSGNATAGVLSVDGPNYAIVTITDDPTNSEIDFSVSLLANVIAQYNPSSSNRGIKSFAFDVNVPFTALSGTNAATNGVKNTPSGSGFNWTLPSSRSMDGFGTYEFKLSNSGSARVSTLDFSLDTTNARWSALNALNFFEVSTGTAPQGNFAFAVEVDGISTAGAQGGNPFFAGPLAVPLPAGFVLFGGGLGLLGRFLRRMPRQRPVN